MSIKKLTVILFFILFSPNIFSNEKLLSISDSSRILNTEDTSSPDLFLCLMDGKKVFGKNVARVSECYSVKEQELILSLESFLHQPNETETQIGFYTPEGKQVIPTWDENGVKFSLLAFVVNKNQLYIQSIRKDTKQYFFWKTAPQYWEFKK